jgi:hypothetical protein
MSIFYNYQLGGLFIFGMKICDVNNKLKKLLWKLIIKFRVKKANNAGIVNILKQIKIGKPGNVWDILLNQRGDATCLK